MWAKGVGITCGEVDSSKCTSGWGGHDYKMWAKGVSKTMSLHDITAWDPYSLAWCVGDMGSTGAALVLCRFAIDALHLLLQI